MFDEPIAMHSLARTPAHYVFLVFLNTLLGTQGAFGQSNETLREMIHRGRP